MSDATAITCTFSLVFAIVMHGCMVGCGGAPFESSLLSRDVATDAGREIDSEAETVAHEAAATDPPDASPQSAPEASPTAQPDAAPPPPPACSTPPSGSSCVSGAAPDRFEVLYAGGGCNSVVTPPGCRVCAEDYSCACILAAVTHVCGGGVPVSCTLTDIVTVTCP